MVCFLPSFYHPGPFVPSTDPTALTNRHLPPSLRVDVVVSPVKTTLLGVEGAAYPLVMGDMNLMKLLGLLRSDIFL